MSSTQHGGLDVYWGLWATVALILVCVCAAIAFAVKKGLFNFAKVTCTASASCEPWRHSATRPPTRDNGFASCAHAYARSP